MFEAVREREPRILEEFKSDQARALRVLTGLSNGFAERALNETREKLLRLRDRDR